MTRAYTDLTDDAIIIPSSSYFGPKYTFRPKYDEDGITEGKRHPRSPIKTLSPGPGSYNIKKIVKHCLNLLLEKK